MENRFCRENHTCNGFTCDICKKVIFDICPVCHRIKEHGDTLKEEIPVDIPTNHFEENMAYYDVLSFMENSDKYERAYSNFYRGEE